MMPDDIDGELQQDKNVIAAATPGPWCNGFADGSGVVIRDGYREEGAYIVHGSDDNATIVVRGSSMEEMPFGVLKVEDADFIARARSRMPVLVAQVDALTAELAEHGDWIATVWTHRSDFNDPQEGTPPQIWRCRGIPELNYTGVRYAVRQADCCVNVDGQWEWESLPSSRDTAFYERCRFATFEQAAALAAKAGSRFVTRPRITVTQEQLVARHEEIEARHHLIAAREEIERLTAELAKAKAGGWIKCSDAMPAIDQVVIVSFAPQGEISFVPSFAKWDSEVWDNDNWNCPCEREKVTHWQAMPAPPAE